MKAKLIKVDNGWVLMVNNVMYATDNDKLCLKNCQAIELGYDLDGVVNDIVKTIVPDDRGKDIWYSTSMAIGKLCFQKALELLGDKKYSEEDMYKIFIYGRSIDTAKKYIKKVEDKPINEFFEEFIQSLQQTEWDVEIVMECCGKVYSQHCDGTCEHVKPLLDADRCLILKLKSE